VPDMNAKASEINEPRVLIDRVAYRNKRLLEKLTEKEDTITFVRIMAGYNKTDLNRAPCS
jgi:hypothetical protein